MVCILSLCEVRCLFYRCCWDVCTAPVLFKFRGSVGRNRLDRTQDGTQTRTDPHTHSNTVRGCHKDNALNCGCICTIAPTTYTELRRRVDTYTAADTTAKTKKLKLHRTVFIVRTACCRILGRHTHTLTHSHTSISTVHGCHKGQSLNRGCCCTAAASKYTAFEGWCGTCSRYWYKATERKKAHTHIFGFYMGLVGSSLTERDPLITCQLARL